MMSSEEDTDSFGLYSSDNKSSLLIKTNLNKTLGLNNNQYNFKRNRQRVDAGEPRNTYGTTTSVNSGGNTNNNNNSNNTNNNSNCNNSNSNNNLTAETVLTTLTNLMSSAGGAVAAQQSYGALNNNNNTNNSNNNLLSSNTTSDPLAINNNSSSSPQLSLSPSGQLPTSSTLSLTTTTSTSSQTLSSTTSSTSAAVAAAAQLVGGLFGPNGFGSAKMLNELFGRQMKQAQDATSGLPSATQQLDNSLLAAAIETATSNDLLNVNAINGSGKDSTTTNNTNTMSANTNGSATAQLVGGGPNSPILINNNNNNTADQTNTELAHHMLRNILQGKKELLNSLDPEIRSVFNSASGNGGGILTPRTTPTGAVESNNSENNNNNIINNNKNYTNGAGAGLNNLMNNCIEPMLTQIKSEPSLNISSNNSSKSDNSGQVTTNPSSMQNGHQHHILDEQSDDEGKNSHDMKKESTDDLLDEDMMVALNSNVSDLESIGSPQSSQADELMKNELEAEIEKDSPMSSGQTSKSSEKIDLKRARVENIVSSMRSSPSSSLSNQNQVNGCKKRKLYQPQQHEQQSAMERYAAVAQAAAGLNFAGFNMQNLILNNHIDAEDESQSIQSPQLQQKRVEKNALESQLRSMKERLAEMEQQYVQLCSRMERESECHDLDDNSTVSMEQDLDLPSPSPPLQQQSLNENSPSNQQAQRPMNQNITPLRDNKANQMMLENNPTQMLSQMMSKMMSNSQRHPHFNGAPHPLLQQFGGPHVPVPTDPSSHLPHPLSNALFLGQKFLLEQQAAAKEAAAEHERQAAAAVHQEQQRQQQEHQRQLQQQEQHRQQQQQQNAKKSELTDKFNMLRRNSPASSMSGNELEGLADILKSEILSSISSLVDTILTRYSHQRNMFNKQTDAVQAAAEQFNKDLQMAAHIVDRKSPRTKVASESRSSGKRSPSIQQANQTGNGPLLTNNQLHLTNPTNSTNNNNQNSSTNISSNNNSNNNNLNLNNNNHCNTNDLNSNVMNNVGPRMNGSNMSMQQMHHQLPTNLDSPSTHLSNAANNSNNSTTNNSNNNNSNNNSNLPPPHVRPSPSAAMFQTPKPPQHQGVSGGPVMNPVAAAALYNSMNALGGGPSNGHHHNQVNPFCLPPEPQNMREPTQQEQNEALSLVVQPKKKRHKVTDTRITPRTISRVLAQESPMGPGNKHDQPSTSFNKQNVMQQQHQMQPPSMNTTPAQSPSPRTSNTNNNQQQQQQQQQSQQFHQQPPPPPPPGSMLPVSLPTSVAIPNPSLHESQVFSPYSPFFNPHGPHGPHGGLHAPPNQFNHIKMSSSPPGLSGMMVGNGDSRDSPPLPHPPTMLHPALLAHAAHHGNSPDYSAHLRAAMDAQDRNSDCNSADMKFDGMHDMKFDGIQPTISFLKRTMKQNDSLTSMHSSTLTPMHLRKAKLMFFWVRYPSSAVLKMYFPDIKFNKNNTAQLVKWFSNFREFYYIKMEQFARAAHTDGTQSADDLQVTFDSELYRTLNLHYNRNNHIEVPSNFRFVVEQTLKEFFRSIQSGKDTEQSWKKSIYKIISRMDDPVPEYFKSPNFLEQLE